MDEKELIQLKRAIKEAEQIIGMVKDSALRAVAFKEILKYLLQNKPGDFTKNNPVQQLNPVEMSKNRKIFSNTKEGQKKWILDLVGSKFFNKPQGVKDVLNALDEQGHHLSAEDIASGLVRLTNEKILRRKKMAPEGKRKGWYYSNW